MEFSAFNSLTALRRKFFKKFGIDGRRKKSYRLQDFVRIVEHFQETGTVARKKTTRTPNKIHVAKELLKNELGNEDAPNQISVRKVARKLELPVTTSYRDLRNELKLKPYKFHQTQELNADHQEQRVKFCEWILEFRIDPQIAIHNLHG